MTETDRLDAELAAIRERWSKVAYVGMKPEVMPEAGHQPEWLPDVPHLLAAVEAALALHVASTADPYWCKECGHSFPCWTRRKISAEALREDDEATAAAEAELERRALAEDVAALHQEFVMKLRAAAPTSAYARKLLLSVDPDGGAS